MQEERKKFVISPEQILMRMAISVSAIRMIDGQRAIMTACRAKSGGVGDGDHLLHRVPASSFSVGGIKPSPDFLYIFFYSNTFHFF